MPRQARLSGEYLHIVVRGIGKQLLFEDDTDRRYYLSLLLKYRDECNIMVMSYCLMENHVHLLLRDSAGNASLYMKKLGVSYASYFNKKYDRVGHLFQDRYKSETITDDAGLLAVYRYILNNPKQAGIADPHNYAWNSFHEYGKNNGITDSSMLYDMIGSKRRLLTFLNVSGTREFLEDISVKHDDDWAKEIIKKVLNVTSGTALQGLPKNERDEMLIKLKDAGLSVRQIERLTGINRGVIQKVKSVKKNRPQ